MSSSIHGLNIGGAFGVSSTGNLVFGTGTPVNSGDASITLARDYSNSTGAHHGFADGNLFTAQVFAATIATNDVVTATGHDFVNTDRVIFDTLTGGTGLAINTPYYVVSACLLYTSDAADERS